MVDLSAYKVCGFEVFEIVVYIEHGRVIVYRVVLTRTKADARDFDIEAVTYMEVLRGVLEELIR